MSGKVAEEEDLISKRTSDHCAELVIWGWKDIGCSGVNHNFGFNPYNFIHFLSGALPPHEQSIEPEA